MSEKSIKTEYVLEKREREVLAELDRLAQKASDEATLPFRMQMIGILTLISRQQDLAIGTLRISEDKTKLEVVPLPKE